MLMLSPIIMILGPVLLSGVGLLQYCRGASAAGAASAEMIERAASDMLKILDE